MKLEQSFEVQAPIDVVWQALNDLERVAPCLPGATLTGHDEDGTYHGEFKVKLGPTTAAYRGTIRISEADEATHTATLVAKGTDKRGQGGANATIVNTLTEAGDATRVEAVTDFTITGRLARFGRGGMIEDISNRLLRDFGACLATRLGEQPSGAAVTAGAVAPEALAAPPAAAAETTGAAVTAGDAAPESVAAAAPAPPASSSGAEVAAGAAAPEAAAAPATEAGEVAPGATSAEDASAGAAPPPPAPQAAPAGAGTPGPGPVASTPPPTTQPAAPLDAGGLFFSVLWERIKRFFRRRS
jgi:carbon monoxide dehydrogenase subunit G